MKLRKIMIISYIVLGLGVLYYLFPFYKQNAMPDLKIEIPTVLADDMLAVHYINKSVDQINLTTESLDELFFDYQRNSKKRLSNKVKEKFHEINRKATLDAVYLSSTVMQIKKNFDLVKTGFTIEKVKAVDSIYVLIENQINCIYSKYRELEECNVSNKAY